MTLLMTLSDPYPPPITPFSVLCFSFHIFVTGVDTDFEFSVLTDHSKSQPVDEKSSLRGGRDYGHVTDF